MIEQMPMPNLEDAPVLDSCTWLLSPSPSDAARGPGELIETSFPESLTFQVHSLVTHIEVLPMKTATVDVSMVVDQHMAFDTRTGGGKKRLTPLLFKAGVSFSVVVSGRTKLPERLTLQISGYEVTEDLARRVFEFPKEIPVEKRFELALGGFGSVEEAAKRERERIIRFLEDQAKDEAEGEDIESSIAAMTILEMATAIKEGRVPR